MTNWKVLEDITNQCAVPLLWRELGDEFIPFARAFLEVEAQAASTYPCRKCACLHEIVVLQEDLLPRTSEFSASEDAQGFILMAVCRCEPWICDSIPLSRAEILPLCLSWSKLGRALAQALGLESLAADLRLPRTRQIGAWSTDAVPVILSVQPDRASLRNVIAELVARLKRNFILLGPTHNRFDARCQELLAKVDAAFLPLDQIVRFQQNGSLQPVKLPGDLFAKFTPQPSDQLDENNARHAFGLVRALETELRIRKAPILTVFRLFCIENLSISAIARKCGCSRPIIFLRLEALRNRLGCDPASLRRYSAHFENIERSLRHSAAKSIYRKGAAFGDEDPED